MGRYSSVQAYADNNSNVRTVSYEQATGSTEVKRAVVKPEKVVNPYGSTAGAGSGEFHIYRHARQREMERMQQLTEEEQEKLKDEEFYDKIQKDEQEQEAKTAKKRKKRQRQKEAKQRKKNLALAGIKDQSSESKDDSKIVVVEEIPNDGSFLERMKQKLVEETEKKESDEAEDETEEPPAKKQAT